VNSGSQTRPVVVCDESGAPVDLAYQNEKGFKKTLEQGHLWVLHETTGRLLPYKDDRPCTVVAHDAWYVATIGASAGPGESSRPHPDSDADSPGSAPSGTSADFPNVVTALAALIGRRRQEMPEGSYTTHLFSSGAEKIRKKLGEEAVELILAPDREHQVSEAADLIYHLLVLLESEQITLADLAAELRKR
jgi:phosphoribosyl-ATP pyrophosphohydrolase